MDKYGVETDQGKTKTASEKRTCPECGAELVLDSNVPRCPVHGTKPFERERSSAMAQAFAEAYGPEGKK